MPSHRSLKAEAKARQREHGGTGPGVSGKSSILSFAARRTGMQPDHAAAIPY